ncbi:hypothetical protein FHX74_002559 [Friedmanniella endophytica]|uniref:Uncharacterized protein n=1 Tax=Microlunatus kandeliicorticis TaxID=1759536 RepID=A0A7W3ITG8_9ACTN|nr:hypothetical protein [Microlunatus kandeliicorticis]MBA8794931.1 hypothetical protein [Microlunatus kandeliicorticis]
MKRRNAKRRPVRGAVSSSSKVQPTKAEAKCSFTRRQIATPTGVDLAIENASRDTWYASARTAVQQLALTGRAFTVDQVLDLVGQPPASAYVGAVMAGAQRSGLIEPVGCQVGAGGRLVRRWWGLSDGTRIR